MKNVGLGIVASASLILAASPSTAAVSFYRGDTNPNAHADWLAAQDQAITTLDFENGIWRLGAQRTILKSVLNGF